MNRWTVLIAAIIMVLAISCSNGGAPTSPTTNDLGTTSGIDHSGQAQTHIWGFYNCWLDTETMTIEQNVNRTLMFTANVVDFVNKPPTNLGFNIIEILPDAGGAFIDVDIDVSITHPFAGLSMYDGYDVRGIFIGDRGKFLKYKTPKLKYATDGNEQTMMDDPDGADGGGADGYTRWWNPSEFATPGILGYTRGVFASAGYVGDATVNPYKYFADDLGSHDDAFGFLTSGTGDGVFTAGTTNTRNYYLRFPTPTPNVMFNYAIAASWIDETTHPANGPEAMAASITMTDDIWNDGAGGSGGDLKFDVSIQGWADQPSSIFVESNVLTALNTLSNPATGGGSNFSTYEFDVDADGTIPAAGWTGDLWVICEYGALDYTNEFGVPNSCGTDKLASFFRHTFYIANEPYNQAPICDFTYTPPSPITGYNSVSVTFDASASTDTDGTIVSYEWDFDDDGVFGDAYDSGTDVSPVKTWTADYVGDINLRITDDMGAESECTESIDITVLPLWSEDFTTDPGDWCLQTYQYWSGCTQGLPCWRSTSPYGVAAGSLQTPCSGNYLWGGALQTHVSPSFFMPSSAEVNFRCRAMWDFGGSYAYYTKANFAIANATGTGCSPFSTTSCAGGTIMQSTVAHGGTTPAGWVTSGGSGPCGAYAGWRGNFGSYPSNVAVWIDLIVPVANQNQNVKVAFRAHPDWCYYPGTNDGIMLDDCEIKLY